MSIEWISMPAPSNRYIQASAMTAASPPSTTARSWRSSGARTSAVIPAAVLIDDALVAEVDPGELAIAVHEIGQLNRTARFGGGAADLGDAKLEPVRQINAHRSEERRVGKECRSR